MALRVAGQRDASATEFCLAGSGVPCYRGACQCTRADREYTHRKLRRGRRIAVDSGRPDHRASLPDGSGHWTTRRSLIETFIGDIPFPEEKGITACKIRNLTLMYPTCWSSTCSFEQRGNQNTRPPTTR